MKPRRISDGDQINLKTKKKVVENEGLLCPCSNTAVVIKLIRIKLRNNGQNKENDIKFFSVYIKWETFNRYNDIVKSLNTVNINIRSCVFAGGIYKINVENDKYYTCLGNRITEDVYKYFAYEGKDVDLIK